MKKRFLLLAFVVLVSGTISAQNSGKDSIKNKLLEAKRILEEDGGKLWGCTIWNDSIIIIDYDYMIYSLVPLAGSETDDQVLYYKTMEPNSLVFVNTTQECQGGEFATVVVNSLKDNSSTVIHELFHLLQHKFRRFKGDPVNYLDETEARILLRLEYQALRNTLNAINDNRPPEEIHTYLKDAITFRKERQNKYNSYLTEELDIETQEGLANYTGFVLSTYENKYKVAIAEINQREQADTYTRPFPYATGPAYGLIFDYLHLDWKKGLYDIYNFAEIYDNMVTGTGSHDGSSSLDQIKERNNYYEIYNQESEREAKQKILIEYYTDLFINKPTLKVAIHEYNDYRRSYNMNGAMTLQTYATVFSDLSGEDVSGGNNFGDFFIKEGKGELGIAGILGYTKEGVYYLEFPLPLEINGREITGEFYEISLNPQWSIVEYTDGNMEIVKN